MNFEFIEGGEARDKVVKFKGVRIADDKIVHDKSEDGEVGVVAETHGGGSFRMRSRVGTGERQVGVEIRALIGEDWGQFSGHHSRERVCRGSDEEKVGDQVL